MDDRYLKLKDAIEVVRETVADEYIESTLELRLLDQSLPVDVVEVVRRADCKWFQPINNSDHGYCGTPFHGAEVYEDDYCSDGERVKE